jgi:23S rRNA (adenine2503-C2)-methyltransferase
MPDKQDIKGMTLEALTEFLSGQGKERFRAKQIFRWIYSQDAPDFERMTNLTKALRIEMDERFAINRFKLIDTQTSADSTQKLLFELSDGETLETVIIPGAGKRLSLCISSQVGCPLACTFCRTGKSGFVRNLTTGEIVEQVLASGRHLGDRSLISNIVIMGMGEPLLNYDAVLDAIRILYTDAGPNFSARKITLSTAGLPEQLAALGKAIDVSLAISLHAVDDETRNKLMPINKKYPIAKLMEACKNYPLGNRRYITFEYLLIKGINDSDEQARKLAKLVLPLQAKINLIAFNPFEGCDYEAPSPERVLTFQNILINKKITTMLRKSRGADILAACGQLRAKVGGAASKPPVKGHTP